MGKFKRNKGFRGQSKVGAYLNNGVDAANADVRVAEQALFEARQRAATAAAQARAPRAAYQAGGGGGAAYRAPQFSATVNTKVNLDDASGRAPQDQADAFFNRPGDYFLARFAIGDPTERATTAETVLKASEDQFDYLLEVLRQIRGGFGDRCRIELFRTHTTEREPQNGAKASRNFIDDAVRATQDYATDTGRRSMLHDALRSGGQTYDTPPRPHVSVPSRPGKRTCCNTYRGDQHYPACMYATKPIEPDDLPPQQGDLTREQIQQQLPGMTRAQAAAELGVPPEQIGGAIYETGDLQRQQLADELGVPVETLQPIAMQGGGNAYAVTPQAQPAAGRHAAPDVDPDFDCIGCGQRRTVDTPDGWRCLNCGASDTASR